MQTLNQDIKNNDFKKVYLLFGEEAFLKKSYKNRLREAITQGDSMNYNYYEGKGMNVNEIISLSDTMPFFAEKRLILMEDSGWFKGGTGADEMSAYIENIPDTTCLLFVETEVDKRSRMYKAVKNCGRIVEFAKQDEKTLMRWAAGILAREGRKITTRDMELFLTKTGTDMGNIRMELEKLITYTMGQDIVTREDIEEICTTRTENKIFDMVRAVTERNQRRALDLYNDLLTLREPPMRILFLLSKQFRQMCLAKKMAGEGSSQNEIATRLGVPSFVARNILACARAYSVEELEQAEEDFVDAEEAVKTGRLQDVLSVELLIVKYSTERKR